MNEFEEKLKKAHEAASLKIWKEWRELTGCGQTCFLCGSKIPIVCPLLKFFMNSEDHQQKERVMAQLTEKQKKDYLENPYHCPFCGSDQIEGQERESEMNQSFQKILCLDCKKKWTDIYTLSDVETDEN